jgi:low temperature requirement protein LtrA
MNGHSVLVWFCLGGAALAAWLIVRFPSAGPQRFSTVTGSVLALSVGLSLAAAVFEKVAGLGTWGIGVALLLVVLPALTASFWIAGCAMRTLAAMPGVRR